VVEVGIVLFGDDDAIQFVVIIALVLLLLQLVPPIVAANQNAYYGRQRQYCYAEMMVK
jgi:hypothetical protein